MECGFYITNVNARIGRKLYSAEGQYTDMTQGAGVPEFTDG